MMDASSPQSLQEKTIPRRILFFPLSLKVLLLLTVVSLPSLVLLLVGMRSLPVPLELSTFLLKGILHVGEHKVPVFAILVLASLALSLGVGVALAEVLFIHPARRLLKWLIALRKNEFKTVPPLTTKSADEIGEIGRQIAFAALKFSGLKEQQESAMEERGVFIMTAAHQLRTPLTALLWTVEAVQSPSSSPEEKAKFFSSMGESLERMRLVIEHILAGANVEEGRYGYVFEKIDLVPIIERLRGEYQTLAEKNQLHLEIGHEGAFPIFADKERISLALSDLLSNALLYTPSGGSVTLFVKPKGEDLEVTIQDTGIGISDDERQMLFNKFYRGARARHMRPDGSGLGLYLARNIIEKHGSQLSIDSAEGKGTKITFSLHSEREKVHG